MKHEVKIVPLTELKAKNEGNGGFEGYGSTFGNVDSYGDIIVRGAFKDTIPTFLKRGFNPVGHEWGGLPVAMPIAAKEDEHGLFTEAAFHSTQAAQDARAVVAERIAQGLEVGLSIGYSAQDYEMISVDTATEAGVNVATGPEHYSGGYRLLKKIDLYEVSIVTVPANSEATVISAKSLDGMSFTQTVEYAERLVSDLKVFAERVRSRAKFRADEGRTLKPDVQSRIDEVLTDAAREIEAAKALIAVKAPAPDMRVALIEVERTRAKLATLGFFAA